MGLGEIYQKLPFYQSQIGFSAAGEILIDLAPGSEVVVKHVQHEIPVHLFRVKAEFFEIAHEVIFTCTPFPTDIEYAQQVPHLYRVDLHGRSSQQKQAAGLMFKFVQKLQQAVGTITLVQEIFTASMVGFIHYYQVPGTGLE